MRQVLVVTGTGTGAGKTVVTAAIAALAVAPGRRVAHRAHGATIQHAVQAIASGYPSGIARSGHIVQRGELSGELAAFLASGEPPVFVGFGSMAGSDPTHTTELVLAALAKAGVRAVLATGWGGLSPAELPEGVIAVEQVPHELVFPHVAAVIHHGRAGPTGAAAATGRPQVVSSVSHPRRSASAP